MCGDNRLRQVQLLGGSRNRAALGHGEKRSEQSEVEIVWIHRIPLGGARSGLGVCDMSISAMLIAYPVN
jgi:hypothetical protein